MYYKSKEAINELFNKFKPKSFDELKQIYNSQSEKKCIDINELFEYIQTTKIGSLARGFYKRSKEERAQLSERYRQELSTILKHGGFDFDLNGLDKFHNGYGFSVRTESLLVSTENGKPICYVLERYGAEAFTDKYPINDNEQIEPSFLSICHDKEYVKAILYINGYWGPSVELNLCEWTYRDE